MSGTKATRAREAAIARLLEQCEHADGFRFEVPSAPSITFHVDPGPRRTWAITRFGWVTPVALTEHGWEPLADTSDEDRFIWSITAALAHIPELLDEMSSQHAAWQVQYEAERRTSAPAPTVSLIKELARVGEIALQAGREFAARVEVAS